MNEPNTKPSGEASIESRAKAIANEIIEQHFKDSLTPDRGYKLHIAPVIALLRENEELQAWLDSAVTFAAFALSESPVKPDDSTGDALMKSVIDAVRREYLDDRKQWEAERDSLKAEVDRWCDYHTAAHKKLEDLREAAELVASARDELGHENATLRARVEELDTANKEAIGCFVAAEVEGLLEALMERDGEKLAGLYERRIGFAYHALTGDQNARAAIDAATKGAGE